MSENQFNPGAADIEEAIMKSSDGSSEQNITAQIVSFSLSQSMDSASYTGTLTLLDGINLLEGFPIRAEESIDLRIKGHDLNTEINLKVQVYKVDEITVSESAGSVLFTINFVSAISYKASTRRVVAGLQNKSMDQIARYVFNGYYSPLNSDRIGLDENNRTFAYAAYRKVITAEPERNFILQSTANMTDMVIPNYIPEEAMHYLCGVAFNPETPSSSWKFFETLDNYYFATDEFFIKTANRNDLINLFYSPAASYDPRFRDHQVNRIEELTVMNKGLDTIGDLYSGAYRNKTLEIDLVRRRTVTTSWSYDENANYIDMSGDPVDKTIDTHTSAFRDKTFTDENARDFIVFKDYQSNGDIPSSLHTNRYLPQIVGNKVSYGHHLTKTVLSAKMKGRLDIRPGMIVNLDVQQLNGIAGTPSLNTTMSGKYLVNTVNHNRDDSGTLHCGLKLYKFGWSKGDTNV